MDLTKYVKITYNLKMDKPDFDDLTNVIMKLEVLFPKYEGLMDNFTEGELRFIRDFILKSDEIYREEYNCKLNI